jgi:eight-cysteine-cluster-containing protein
MAKAVKSARKPAKAKISDSNENFDLSKRRTAAVLGVIVVALILVSFAYIYSPRGETPPTQTCKNMCGDGVCQKIVCEAIGCPCAEDNETCPQDCKLNQTAGSIGTLQTNDQEAQATALDYVHHLYCFNNYNSSNLQELNFTKVSDNNSGTYNAHYIFNISTDQMLNVPAMDVKLIISNGIVSSAKVSRVTTAQEGFCGYSTNGPCSSNGDCVSDGCSGQICRSTSEKSIISTCEWKDCYSAEKYGLSCKCLSGQCIWN